MSRNQSRRTILRGLGAAAGLAAGGLAAGSAGAADCDATVYTNATEGGEPKLEVPAAEDARITGESTCAAGTELSVRARHTGGNSPFVKASPGVVQSGGGWAAAFDFTAQDPGQTFEVTVVHEDGTELDALANCEVVGDAPTPQPTPSPTPTPTDTATPAQDDGSGGDGGTGDGDSPTPTGAQGEPGTPTGTAAGTPTLAPTETPGSDDEAATDGQPGERTDTPTPDSVTKTPTGSTQASGPGFGLLAAVGGLAAAAWRLRDDT